VRFVVPQDCTFDHLYAHRDDSDIGQHINTVLEKIEDANKAKLHNVTDQFNRFHAGIPPKSKGDWAFISHMIASANAEKGRVGVVVPHGVLFRGGQEGAIRKYMIDMAEVQRDIERINRELAEVETKMDGYLQELGFKS